MKKGNCVKFVLLAGSKQTFKCPQLGIEKTIEELLETYSSENDQCQNCGVCAAWQMGAWPKTEAVQKKPLRDRRRVRRHGNRATHNKNIGRASAGMR